jgi:UDP-N-acetylmuramoylalanine--D-glutamate ligase
MVELAGKRVLVVGLGKSGLAAVRLLASRGARVVANDLRSEAELGDAAGAARAAGAELVLGAHDAALFTSVDHIVLSPGVPPMPALEAADAAGIPIASEVELASWFISASVIAITGTNGKSTVTTLVGEMCKRSGRPTFVGGNLGTPFVDVVGTAASQRGGYVVVELSSYQLERVARLRVNVAALLNLTDDHLDRYATFDAYAAAKANVFRCQRPGDAAVVPAGDMLCQRYAQRGPGTLHLFGGGDGVVRVIDGFIVDAVTGPVLAVDALHIKGAHNVQNACAAALCARLSGVAPEHVQGVLSSFTGLPHRMFHVADISGVAYYDDSKATNVGAAVAALDGFAEGGQRVVLIAGGKDKGGDYGPLRQRLRDVGRGVVLIGEATPIIRGALSGEAYAIEQSPTLEAAVETARAMALPGDVVLLAPACASFDMFRSYAHRGDVFQEAVRRLQGGV